MMANNDRLAVLLKSGVTRKFHAPFGIEILNYFYFFVQVRKNRNIF